MNKYIDLLTSSDTVKTLIKKDFSCKTSYWLARIFSELESLSKTFGDEKDKIIDKYAKKDDKGEVITDNGNITITDIMAFQKNLSELLEIKLKLEAEKIAFDIEEEPKCTIEEMLLLLPLIEVKND